MSCGHAIAALPYGTANDLRVALYKVSQNKSLSLFPFPNLGRVIFDLERILAAAAVMIKVNTLTPTLRRLPIKTSPPPLSE